jgi:hypothetical protein
MAAIFCVFIILIIVTFFLKYRMTVFKINTNFDQAKLRHFGIILIKCN